MIGEWLCRLGWHRWQYKTTIAEPTERIPCYVSTTTRRCRRCRSEWIVWSQSSSW